MSDQKIFDLEVMARRARRCNHSGCLIKPRESYFRRQVLTDGTVWSVLRICWPCVDLIQAQEVA